MTILRAIQCWQKIHFMRYLVVSYILLKILITRQGQPILYVTSGICALYITVCHGTG